MVGGCINPFFHHLRIVIQFISPQRILWLIMPLKAGVPFLLFPIPLFPQARTYHQIVHHDDRKARYRQPHYIPAFLLKD